MSEEIREIPLHIQRTFQELRGNESWRTALQWFMQQTTLSREIGELDESAQYRKGMQDAYLFQAEIMGMGFTQTLENKQSDENNETTTDVP